jgi:hypothetical protein
VRPEFGEEKKVRGLPRKEDKERKNMRSLDDEAIAYRNRKDAKLAMLEWKEKTGIKAIVRKTDNQKLEKKLYDQRMRSAAAHENISASLGPASEVRKIDPREI